MSPALKNKLKVKAKLLADIRDFFARKQVLEVNTDLLRPAAITDPYLNPLSLLYNTKIQYLQTSPEYAMKILLSQGSGCIYQICKAFRNDEIGRLHKPEFTLLEWYRIGFDHHDLMNEMDEFLQYILPHSHPAIKYTYQFLFEHYLDVNPHTINIGLLKKLLKKNNIILNNSNYVGYRDTLDKDDYLQLLFNYCIEPELKKLKNIIFVYDYPASQAALARIYTDNHTIKLAQRFEVYINGIELANGYHELNNYTEQKKRFTHDLHKRKKLGLPLLPMDTELLSALKTGFPDCAGVALGIDRLLMILQGEHAI